MANLHLGKQFGFDELLSSAHEANTAFQFEHKTAHLPSSMEEALPFFRALLRDHNEAMMNADEDRVFELREEAWNLARKLNNNEPGCIANDDAPGCVLERMTSEACGHVPLWGQTGEFIVTVGETRVRIAIDGVFGVGSTCLFWPGFSARVVDLDKPFISGTGYRSFIGINVSTEAGMTPDGFAKTVIETYIEDELGKELVLISEHYRSQAH